MKKIVGVVIFIIIIVLGIFVSYVAINAKNDIKTNENTVTIIQNKINSDEKEVIYITNEEHIKEIEKIYNELLKLNKEHYDLTLIETTDIILNDEKTITIQLSNSSLCKYTGLGLSEFVDTPQELVDWINKVL